jgi:hypothetical protein
MKLKGFFVGATLLLALAGSAQAQNFGGRYQVQGSNMNGAPYAGVAEIKVISSTTCTIRWQTGGGSVQDGICMRNGPAFSAAYAFEDGKVGLVIYRVLENGTLDGLWTVAGMNGAGKETLTPMR